MNVFSPRNGLETRAKRFFYVVDKLSLTMKEVAERLGLSSSYMYEIKKERRQPSRVVLRKLAELSGCSLEWLETGKEAVIPKRTPQITREISVKEASGVLAKHFNLTEEEVLRRMLHEGSKPATQ